jgi:hypothetical protein
MTKQEAEEVASEMRSAGWSNVWLEIDDNGSWRAVAADWDRGEGWLHHRNRLRKEHSDPQPGT